jgi:hypothetical protein
VGQPVRSVEDVQDGSAFWTKDPSVLRVVGVSLDLHRATVIYGDDHPTATETT